MDTNNIFILYFQQNRLKQVFFVDVLDNSDSSQLFNNL